MKKLLLIDLLLAGAIAFIVLVISSPAGSEGSPSGTDSAWNWVSDLWSRMDSGDASLIESVLFLILGLLAIILAFIGLVIFIAVSAFLLWILKKVVFSRAFPLLILPLTVAGAGVWGAVFGQKILRETDMEALRTKLIDDPWLYSALEWFRNLEIGFLEGFLIWLSAFLLGEIVFGIIYQVVKAAGGGGSQQKTTGTAYVGGYGYGDYGGLGYSSAKEEPATNPLLQASRVDRTNFWGERNLRDSSGRKVGSLSDATFSNDQVMKDSSGTKAGRVVSGKFDSDRWDFSRQEIQDDSGNRVGDIKTNWNGERVIVNSDGKEIGKFENGKIVKK